MWISYTTIILIKHHYKNTGSYILPSLKKFRPRNLDKLIISADEMESELY